MATDRQPIADDIPVEIAWREGRRYYVATDYGSPAQAEIKAAGGHWEPRLKAWRTSKKDVATSVARRQAGRQEEKADRRRQAGDVLTRGVPVLIPYEASDIREQAKAAGGVWDRDAKRWVLPDEGSAAAIRAALSERANAALAADRNARAATAEETEVRLEAQIPQVAAMAGRTVVGRLETLTARAKRTCSRAALDQECAAVRFAGDGPAAG